MKLQSQCKVINKLSNNITYWPVWQSRQSTLPQSMARKQKVGVDGILVLNANCLRYPMLKFQSAAKLWPWRLLVKHEPNTYKLCLKHKLVLTFPSADCKTATILHETLLGWENAIKLSLSFSPHHQHSAKTVSYTHLTLPTKRIV